MIQIINVGIIKQMKDQVKSKVRRAVDIHIQVDMGTLEI